MKRVEVPRSIEPWRIVCAAQSEPDYSEERQILCYASERGDYYHNGGPFVLIDGGHCSCYDWEDVEWYATEYTLDEIEALAKSKVGGDGCYYESERKFWESVCLALGIEVDK